MEYRIFDAHSDTISKLLSRNEGLRKNSGHIDFERMRMFSGYAQVFAAFVDKYAIETSPKIHIEKIIAKYKKEIKKCKIAHVENLDRLENEKYSSILSIEGGEAIEGSLENLERFYSDGVRIMALTWNYRNEICDGIGEPEGDGLTNFGKRVVKKMNDMKMVIDVSHISQKGFWDVVCLSQKPIIASHSNVKALCNHKRNLSDEQIKAIIETNGVIGMNFYPVFLDNTGKCRIEKIIQHMEYILELGGENSIGFGSDFDGIECLPEDMTGIESVSEIISAMEKRGYKKELMDKILFGNFLRVIKANFL